MVCALVTLKRNQSIHWSNPLYEVVSLLVMIGKRGHLTREDYRRHYSEADEIAAMITGAIRSISSSEL